MTALAVTRGAPLLSSVAFGPDVAQAGIGHGCPACRAGGASMSVDVKYRTTATARGGRDGSARTEDGTFEVKLTTPKELGGAGGPGNNPEQLFAAGYAACFIGAMKFAANGLKLRVPPEA